MKYETERVESQVINYRNTGLKGTGHYVVVKDEQGKTVFCSSISGTKSEASPEVQALRFLREVQPAAT